MAKVLVTGASGLLAANTILELLDRGYLVKALVRDKTRYALSHTEGVETIEGDLADLICIEDAVKDCDFIIHAAAETNQGLTRYADYHRTNVEYTKNLFKIASKNGVKRIIHVSTSNVYGYGDLQHPGTENTLIKKPFNHSLYVKSKIAAQDLAFDFSDKTEVIVVNPTFLIGPYDKKPSSGRILLFGYNKRIIFYPPGGKNFVDVRDAGKAIVSSLKNGKNTEAYISSGENLTYKEFFEKVGSHSDNRPFLIKIPVAVLLFTGVIGNTLKLLGVKNDYTLNNMKILCVRNFYSNAKATNNLNIVFNPIDDAISEAISWFKANGMLNR